MIWTKRKKHKMFNKGRTYFEQGFTHTVTLPWKTAQWNLLCADVIEVFGLQGDRWAYYATPDDMYFMFKSEKDKKLCTMLLSEHL